jgi:hypothetical protein
MAQFVEHDVTQPSEVAEGGGPDPHGAARRLVDPPVAAVVGKEADGEADAGAAPVPAAPVGDGFDLLLA